MATAIALTGAIIESQNGSTMRYYSQCNACRDVTNSTTFTSIPSIGNMLSSTFRCTKCGKSTEIKIKGV